MKKITAIVPKPWINKPNITVQKYAPNLPTIIANDSISMIFATTKKNTPSGDSLRGIFWYFQSIHLFRLTDENVCIVFIAHTKSPSAL